MSANEQLYWLYALLVDVRMDGEHPNSRLRLAQQAAQELELQAQIDMLEAFYRGSAEDKDGNVAYDPATYAGEHGWMDRRYVKSCAGGYEELEAQYPFLEEKLVLADCSPELQALAREHLLGPYYCFDIGDDA